MAKQTKHPAYQTVRVLIEAGHITTFEQIFEHLPKTVAARDLGANYRSFALRVKRPLMLRNAEQFALAHRIGIDRLRIVALVLAQLDKGLKK